ncbi:zinc-dependent metalloprotease [Actinoplanes sp. CA-015351]|uniref:Putative hydrolase n=1 Tax=Actinoplanes lutulentus TaxID=1287878 RepID=A0A327Z729_9ACTN|nr:zinc-dependent metalloprotease [Actinoplanes lutulentus]MBB2946156.1 putative hydrolase [Actinoplanes lutulentus]RAK32846.1 putative hydrolase [Actinoplanes lutulentus]
MPDIPFGFSLPGAQPPDPSDPQQMQQFMAQLQQMFAAPGNGPVNWDLARQVAASQLSASGDPSVNMLERHQVEEALRLADLWLDPVTALPSGVHKAVAWNRNEWIYNTLDVWKKLCEPIAGRMVGAMGDLVPEEARAQLGPMQSMVATLGGALFGGQLGQAFGQLAAEVLSAGDIGLPLGPAGTAALIPSNIKAYGSGLELPEDQVRLYVALREAAHQRLFGHVPWLRSHVLSAVETYANGITVNREAIEDAMSRVDPSDPESMQQMALEGIFTPEDTPQQKASLARLETALALVEGWVGHVVDAAAADRLPSVAALGEAFRRRRGAGGPAEQTFAALVGLELRPRRLREAGVLWASVAEQRGIPGRDALWDHPDLLPTDEDFASPETFAAGRSDWDISELDNLGDGPKED